jgi:hypothetical protein
MFLGYAGFIGTGCLVLFLASPVGQPFSHAAFCTHCRMKKASLKSVIPSLSLQCNRIFAGNDFKWTATLHNRKWLPLVWAEWTFADTEGLQLTTDNPDFRTLRFLWIMWHGKASWTEKGKAVKRGVYDLGKIQLISGDGFRFAENVKRWHLPGEIYVYPKIIPVRIRKLQLPRQWSAEGQNGGIFEDPLFHNRIETFNTNVTPDTELRVFYQNESHYSSLSADLAHSLNSIKQ